MKSLAQVPREPTSGLPTHAVTTLLVRPIRQTYLSLSPGVLVQRVICHTRRPAQQQPQALHLIVTATSSGLGPFQESQTPSRRQVMMSSEAVIFISRLRQPFPFRRITNPPIAYWQILPTDALGKEYFVLAYGNPSTASSTEGSEFVIVATANGTTVTINPTADVNTRPSGTAYQITLDQGQTYRAATGVANADYSGTLISATQPIAVISGHTCAKIPTSTSVCSTVLEELFPTTGWSRNFILSPFASIPPGTSGDRIRMVANSNGTVININSTTTVNLDRGGLYETNLTGTSGNPDPTIITSNFPILVAQYSKDSTDYASAAASNRSEPSMLLVPGYDQRDL